MKVLNIVYLVIYLGITTNVSAQGIFQLQNPSYLPEALNSFTVNSGTGWAIGNYGLILRTTNSGLTFYTQTIPTESNFQGQSLVNPQVCYIFDDTSNIYKTINAGLNWYLTYSFSMRLNSLYFTDNSTGFAALSNGVGITYNGGQNWTILNPDNSASYEYNGIFFTNGNTGFVGAKNLVTDYAFIFKTTNAGINWVWFNTGIDAYQITNLYFLNNMTGWCTGERFGKIYTMKTTNGGVNWTEANTPSISTIPNNLYFSDSSNGYIATNNKILKSNNGGLVWFILRDLNGVNSSFFNSAYEYYLVDEYSRVLKTSDGGSTFDTLLGKQNRTLNRIKIINQDVLWCNGDNNANLISTNGGGNWIFDNYSASLNIRYCEYANASTGYAISGRGNILKTTNFGNNWSIIYSNSGEIFSLNFLNSFTGWVISGDSILQTSNGGNNWTGVSNANSLIRTEFFKGQIGFGFSGNQLFRTTNSGFNWTLTYTGTVIDFDFINSFNGWIISDGDSVSYIHKTSNSGINWNLVATINGNLNKIKFLDENTGYLLSFDKLYRTTNSGVIWKFVKIPTALRVFDFDFIDANEGWLCGDNSLIMKIEDGGAIFVNNETEIADGISLSQNYPNPFNSETNFIITLPKNEFASLKVYDMLGREVSMLMNGELSAGRYRVSFKANGLSSGIYYYVLKTGNRTITRKFVLLK